MVLGPPPLAILAFCTMIMTFETLFFGAGIFAVDLPDVNPPEFPSFEQPSCSNPLTCFFEGVAEVLSFLVGIVVAVFQAILLVFTSIAEGIAFFGKFIVSQSSILPPVLGFPITIICATGVIWALWDLILYIIRVTPGKAS